MKSLKNIYKFMVGAACAIAISACGGGGGDSGSSGLSYTGLTTAAAITATNGEEIAAVAYINGEGSGSLGTVFASITEVEGSHHSSKPVITTTVETLLAALNKLDLTAPEAPSLNLAIQSDSGNLPNGSCGGTANYSISINDVTGEFNGSFTFTNYCETNETLNGTMSISGSLNLNTYAFGNMTITLSSFSSTVNGEVFTLDGAISVNPSASPIVTTINLKIYDGSIGKVFWAENYIAAITTAIGHETFDLSGRFYHPDHGYVTLTTPTPFYIANNDDWPSAGVMIATGANDSKVKLTAISNTTYNYEVDSDGDGDYETQQLGQLWATL